MTKKKKKPDIRCSNCGALCTAKFCPECGQATSVGRLANRTFFVDLLSGLLRVNRGFFYTAWNLLIHPWEVIRRYIRGQRVAYTQPLSMLILLCFFSTVLSGFTEAKIEESATALDLSAQPSAYRVGYGVAQLLKESPVVQILILYLPALLAVPVVYGRKGARRYNFAELFCALLYMIDTLLLFNLITQPLHYILPEMLTSTIESGYTLFIISFSLYHAFPMHSVKKSIIYFVAYLLTAVAFYAAITLILYRLAGW